MNDLDINMEVNPDRRPLYIQAKEMLEVFLRQGNFLPNAKLPPEPELADLLGVSRGTLREALRLAQQEGMIVQRQGYGTFVAQLGKITENGLAALESLDAMSHRRGWSCKSLDLVIEPYALDQAAADTLEREPNSPATRVSLVKLIEAQRVAYIRDIIPTDVVSSEEVSAEFQNSTLEMLRGHEVTQVALARSSFLAVNAGEEPANAIGVPVGQSLLLIEETLYSKEQTPVAYSLNYFVSDFFHFYIMRST